MAATWDERASLNLRRLGTALGCRAYGQLTALAASTCPQACQRNIHGTECVCGTVGGTYVAGHGHDRANCQLRTIDSAANPLPVIGVQDEPICRIPYIP